MVHSFIIKHKSRDLKIPMIMYSYVNEYNEININNYIVNISRPYIPKTLFKPFHIEQPVNIVNSSR